jgi:hypothetical protein
MKLRATAQGPDLEAFPLFVLMTGEPANAWLPGWVAFYRATGTRGPTRGDLRLWAKTVVTPAILEWLSVEAATHHFEPWAVTRRRPTGDGVTAWRAAFMAEHGRRP